MFELFKGAPRCFSVMLVVCCMFLAHGTANAQNPQWDCDAEITDPDQKWTAELCSAHAGCKLVFAIQKGCVKTKRFLTGLRDAIGEGTKSLFGYRKEITPDAIFEASTSDNLKAAGSKPELAETARSIKEKVRSAGKSELQGSTQSGGTYKYYGDVVDGKSTGVGTTIFSNGKIERGNYVNNNLEGLGEVMVVDRERYVGGYTNGSKYGTGAIAFETGTLASGRFEGGDMIEGKYVAPSGRLLVGTFNSGRLEKGAIYYPNGALQSKGEYENGVLVQGKSFDQLGKVTDVTTLLDRYTKIATDTTAANDRAKREREQEITSRAAADKQKVDAMARDERQFQTSLNSLNVGQLFAKADELKSQGDSAKSRDALRALIARFPNHALATTAAQQLSGNAASAEPRSGTTQLASTSSSGQGISAGASATFKSICHRDWEKLSKFVTQKINGLPRDISGESIRSMNLIVQFSERCASYDADSRRQAGSYRESIKNTQDRDQNSCMQGAKWCQNEARRQALEYDQIFSAELSKALSDPNYSADLKGSVGGTSGANGSGIASSSSNKSGACDADLSRIGNTVAQNQSRVGQGAVKGMELVLWSLSESIKVIDRSCPTEPQYVAMRQRMQANMASTKQSCDQMSTSTCVARLP